MYVVNEKNALLTLVGLEEMRSVMLPVKHTSLLTVFEYQMFSFVSNNMLADETQYIKHIKSFGFVSVIRDFSFYFYKRTGSKPSGIWHFI